MTTKEAVKILRGVSSRLTKNHVNFGTVSDVLKAYATIKNHFYKYRWHDLRKNPEDLPKRDGEYYVYQYVYFLTSSDPNSERCEPAYCIDTFKNGKFENSFDGSELIAWREIEPFELEEEVSE